MSNGLGFNNYTSGYMSRVVNAGGTTPGLLVQQAIEDLSVGVWLRFNVAPVACYPFYGGTADSHSQNLFGSLYTITWTGAGVTHNTNGVTGDGVDYGYTGLIPSNVLNVTSVSMGMYVRTNTAADVFDMGCAAGSNNMYLRARTVAGNLVGTCGSAVVATAAVAASTGLITVHRSSNTSLATTRNGGLIGSSVTAASSLPIFGIGICAAVGLGSLSTRNIAFAFVAPVNLGTLANHLALYTVVQAFQTVLARQV